MPGWAHASKSAQVCPGVPMPSDVAKSGYLGYWQVEEKVVM